MSFDSIPNLLSDILVAQRQTNEYIVRLTEAIAGVRAKVEAERSAAPAPLPAASAPATEPAPAPAPAPAAAPAEPAAVDFDTLKRAFLALATKDGGRARCEAVLKPFGLAKLSEAKPEHYPALMAEIAAQA